MNCALLNLLFLQFFAHILVDFYFQTDKSVAQKQKNGFKSKAFKLHILVYFLLSWLFSLELQFGIFAFFLAIINLSIDLFKNRLSSTKTFKPYAFYIDQLLHFLSIWAMVFAYNQLQPEHPLLDFNTGIVLYPLMIISLIKPSNILIRELFNSFNFEIDFKDELPKAGSVIGSLERLIILLLIVTQQYTGIGFLIGIKSILRYNADSKKSEYVLIGSMLSFLIGALISLLPYPCIIRACLQ